MPDKTIDEIRATIQKLKFPQKRLLQPTAEVLERYGWGAAKLYALGKGKQRKALLKTLLIMQQRGLSLANASFIIQRLNALKAGR